VYGYVVIGAYWHAYCLYDSDELIQHSVIAVVLDAHDDERLRILSRRQFAKMLRAI
jgi:hypothetical protein